MTKLLERGIAAIRNRSPEFQDEAGALLLSLAQDDRDYVLSPEQIAGIHEAIRQVEAGQFAGDEEVEAVFARRR